MRHSHRFHQTAGGVTPPIREVSPADAKREQVAGAVLVDVRESDEVAQGYATGAMHVSLSVFEQSIQKALPDLNTPVLLICAAGVRSLAAAEYMQHLGYTNVASMAGGFRAWKNEGLPTS